MSDTLPPLPEPAFLSCDYSLAWSVEKLAGWSKRDSAQYTVPLFTADQMRSYAAVAEPVAYSIGRTLHWHPGRGVNDAQLYAAPPQREPLTDEQMRSEFAKLHAEDDAILHLAENNRDFMLEAIGARHALRAFREGVQAAEQAHGISAPASAPKEQA